MRIGLDVDGILYNWEEQARKLLKKHFNISLPISTEWNSIKDSIIPEQWEWLWSEGLYQLFYNGNPYDGIRTGIDILKDYGKIIIITLVPREIINTRLRWLMNHNIKLDEFRITNGISEKSQVLPLCDVYIDDSPHVVEDILNNTDKQIILWKRPWNQGKNSPKVNRYYYQVSSWDQINSIIRNINRELYEVKPEQASLKSATIISEIKINE